MRSTFLFMFIAFFSPNLVLANICDSSVLIENKIIKLGPNKLPKEEVADTNRQRSDGSNGLKSIKPTPLVFLLESAARDDFNYESKTYDGMEPVYYDDIQSRDVARTNRIKETLKSKNTLGLKPTMTRQELNDLFFSELESFYRNAAQVVGSKFAEANNQLSVILEQSENALAKARIASLERRMSKSELLQTDPVTGMQIDPVLKVEVAKIHRSTKDSLLKWTESLGSFITISLGLKDFFVENGANSYLTIDKETYPQVLLIEFLLTIDKEITEWSKNDTGNRIERLQKASVRVFVSKNGQTVVESALPSPLQYQFKKLLTLFTLWSDVNLVLESLDQANTTPSHDRG